MVAAALELHELYYSTLTSTPGEAMLEQKNFQVCVPLQYSTCRLGVLLTRYHLNRRHPLLEVLRGLLTLCRRPLGGERHRCATACLGKLRGTGPRKADCTVDMDIFAKNRRKARGP